MCVDKPKYQSYDIPKTSFFELDILVFSLIRNGQYSYRWSKEQKWIEIQNVRSISLK